VVPPDGAPEARHADTMLTGGDTVNAPAQAVNARGNERKANMRTVRRSLSISLIIGLSMLFLLAGVARAETAVGWELDLSDASIVDSFAQKFFHDRTAGRNVQERYSVEVADGVLRITGDYRGDGDYVRVLIEFPEGIDLLRHPVFEVEWRTDCPGRRGLRRLLRPHAADAQHPLGARHDMDCRANVRAGLRGGSSERAFG